MYQVYKTEQFRDVTIAYLNQEQCLVVSCDSCGGIGNKQNDILKMSPYHVGRYTARVILLEILCVGAEPIIITNGVANEMSPTAETIIKGIKDELSSANLKNVIITGSTEENMETFNTGVGMTGIGIAQIDFLVRKKPSVGDIGVVIGRPKMGVDVVLDHDPELINYTEIRNILSSDIAKQIIPVGSKGVFYEASLVGNFSIAADNAIDLTQSAGPSTCVFVIISKENYPSLADLINAPCFIVGKYL